MTASRKLFSETVSLPGTTATSIETLLRTAGWGFETDSNNAISTTPSMDSFLGDAITVIPTNDAYFGHDSFVRDAAAAGPPRLYQGVLAPAGVPFSITEWFGHVVDSHEAWLYSAGGTQNIQLLFQAI